MRIRTTVFILLMVGVSFSAVLASSNLNDAIHLYQEKKYKEALESLTEICRSTPNSPVAYSYAANCYYVLGERKEAINLYWYVVKNFPNAKEAYTYRAFLKQIDANYAKNSNSRDNTEVPKDMVAAKTASASKAAPDHVEQSTIDSVIKVIKAEGGRPDVTASLIKQVKSVLAAYPAGLFDLMKQHNTKICLTPTMIDIEPGLQNTQPRGYEDGTSYKNCPGCYEYPKIIICEYTLKGANDEDWEAASDPVGTLRHELGHAFDSYVGEVSQTEQFKHAYYLDSGAITDEETKTQIAYFLQKDTGGPSETFAELFCYKYGGSAVRKEHCTLVHSSFPRCAAILQKLIDGLH